MLRRAIAVFVLGAAALVSGAAFAWNAHGHMTAAAVAYARLTPDVQTRVDALLKLNPDYGVWVANVPPEERGLVAFMMAATWPDKIRSDGSHVGSGPTPARNIGYEDKLIHGNWHYINIPLSAERSTVQEPAAPNVGTRSRSSERPWRRRAPRMT